MHRVFLINANIVDILFVCADAISKAKENHFNEEQMKILRDLLKNSLFSRICAIKSWNIEEKDKEKIIDKMLSIANYYMDDVLTSETPFGYVSGHSLFKNNTIHSIKPNKIDYETSNLKRKILKLKQK